MEESGKIRRTSRLVAARTRVIVGEEFPGSKLGQLIGQCSPTRAIPRYLITRQLGLLVARGKIPAALAALSRYAREIRGHARACAPPGGATQRAGQPTPSQRVITATSTGPFSY